MSDDKNKNNENKNIQNTQKQDTRKPLPKGDIIGKRSEIFNLTYKDMFKRDDSSN